MSVLDYLNEAISEVRSYDLKAFYNQFNKELFDNKLPNIPIDFTTSKKWGGRATATKYPDGHITIEKITISDFNKRDEDAIKGILLHEIIHVWMYNEGYDKDIGDKSHGQLFNKKLKELQAKVSFQIPLEDSFSGELSDKIKTKLFDVILNHNTKADYYSIAVLKHGLFEQIDRLKELFDGYVMFEHRKLYFIESDDKELAKQPVKIKFKRSSDIGFYKIDKAVAERILKNGKLIDKLE
jgi:predicted SprT family Zn-dependent metalloprotease